MNWSQSLFDSELSRRRLLLGFSAAAITSSLPSRIQAAPTTAQDERLGSLLTRQFEQQLESDPTLATSFGLDTGARAALRSKFPDWSAEGRRGQQIIRQSNLAAVRTIGRSGLGPEARTYYDSAEFELASAVQLDHFPYHTTGFSHQPGPFPVTQFSGFYTGVSTFLESQHPIKNRADAEAYLARLNKVPALIDADTEITRENAGLGVVAPGFILEQAIRQLRKLRDGNVREKTLVRSIAQRSRAVGLSGFEERAVRMLDGPVRAALTHQIAELQRLLPAAGIDPAVVRLPDGAEYYSALLRAHTTTRLSAEDIHALGLEQVADLNGRMDAVLRSHGYLSGSLRDRFEALAKRDDQRFPNTEQGRKELLDFLHQRLDVVLTRLPKMFSRMPKTPYRIQRIPPEIEEGAPGGRAQPGSLDGTRPAIFWINLRDTAEWPRFMLPTLVFHEAAPGHMFEGGLRRENSLLPIYRRAASSTAYGEGWGLYAEQLGEELSMYVDDPLGKIGYLGSYAFRAARLVIDTGLHQKGWTRRQAVDYMVANTDRPEASAITEVDRYIVMPGQATAYKIGQMTISRLRAEAERHPKFDIRRFHDVVLGAGRIPLAVLERRVREQLFH